MTKTVINFKVDKTIKEEAQEFAKELGMPLSVIINAQLKELLRTRTLNVSVEPRMTPYLENIIEQIEIDRKVGKNIPKTMNADELISRLELL